MSVSVLVHRTIVLQDYTIVNYLYNKDYSKEELTPFGTPRRGEDGASSVTSRRQSPRRLSYGRRIVIPNGNLFTNAVTVNTAFDKRRLEYDVGIDYGDDIDRAKTLILKALRGIEGVLTDPAPDVLVLALADFSVNLRVRWWIEPPRRKDALELQDQVLSAIKKTLNENGIDLPFPTRQILFHDQTEETDGDRSCQREGWPAGKADVPKPRSIGGAIRKLAPGATNPSHNGKQNSESAG